MVRAWRRRDTHRGCFVDAKDPTPSWVSDEPTAWEAATFDIVRQWVALCQYYDGWVSRHLQQAAVIRRKILSRYKITTLEVVIYDYEEIDSSAGSA